MLRCFLQQACHLASVQMGKDLELRWADRMLFWARQATGLRGAGQRRPQPQSKVCVLCGPEGLESVEGQWGIARVNVIMSVNYFKPHGGKIYYK